MKITIYNADGSVKSEQVIEMEIPDYLKHFDDCRKLFLLTQDEKELFVGKDSFPRFLLMDKIGIIVSYDFNLYLRNDNIQQKERTANVINVRDIETFDVLFNSIIYDALLPLLPYNDSVVNVIAPLAKEKVMIPWDELRNKLIKSLFELKEQYETYYNKFRNNGLGIVVSFITVRLAGQALEILKHIWWELKNNYPNRLLCDEILKEISAPFDIVSDIKVNPANYEIGISDTEYKVISNRLWKQLVETAGVGRRRYYHIIRLVDELFVMTSKTHTSNVMAFMSSTYQTMPNNQYDFKLYNTVKRGYKVLSLTDDEISSILTNNQELQGIKETLVEIAKDFNAQNGNDLQSYINKRYEDFNIRNKTRHGDWAKFEEEYSSSKLNLNINPRYHLQESYEELVALQNILGPKVDIDFTNKLIVQLLTILVVNYNKVEDNQDGLYETIYQFNYIKSKIKDKSYTPDDAVDDAMRFIGPLLADPNISDCSDSFNLTSKVRSILELDCIKNELNQKYPTGRSSYIGRFNLVLVLNVLGIFVKLEKIKKSKKSEIERYIQKSSLLNEEAGEWRKYINYKDKDSKLTSVQMREIVKELSRLGVKADLLQT